MARNNRGASVEIEPVEVPAKPVMATTASEMAQRMMVSEKMSPEEILKLNGMPGVELDFDPIRLSVLDETLVAMLSPANQRSYWIAFAEFDRRRKEADRALYETPSVVDPMSKLLDGPHGMSNPLNRDQDIVQRLLGEYYVTWRVQGGQGDLDAALRNGAKIIRRPKDDAERSEKSPLEWSGEIWRVRDGTIDPSSGDEIYNVMVVVRKQAWKDHLAAMSMISHNAYSTMKKQFVEGVDNISRDMSSSKERISTVDLDEFRAEEHTLMQDGKRVRMNS